MQAIDVLMVTYNRPVYTRRSLDHLLAHCGPNTGVWLWHNGNDPETLQVVRSRAAHPQVTRFHHSPENLRLREPTNWLWRESTASLLGKVDDDCLVPARWDVTLAEAHARDSTLGVVAAWRFREEDHVPDLVDRKLRTLPGGTRIMANPWVQGSSYLLKRACVEQVGPLRQGQSFTEWCVQVALAGWDNGWLYPFLYEDHMDDPRSPHSELRDDADLRRHLPLSAQRLGIDTLEAWTERMRESAHRLQAASSDPRDYVGWRGRLHRLRRRAVRRSRRA